MLFEIVMSNLITGFIIGSCLVAYQSYIKYKQNQYYMLLRKQIKETILIITQLMLVYMSAKGNIDNSFLQHLLTNFQSAMQNPCLPVETPLNFVKTFPYNFPYAPNKFNPINEFHKSPNEPYKIPKENFGKYSIKKCDDINYDYLPENNIVVDI